MNSIQDQQFKLLLLKILPLNENSKQALVIQREIDLLNNIFERLKKINCDVEFVNSEDIRSFNNFPNNLIFVLTHFEGEIFTYLFLNDCRIFSSNFINHIITNGLSLPKSVYPRFSNLFTGVTVSFTGLSFYEKDRQTKFIQYMGGNVSGELNYSVTHVVSESCNPSSEKYKACQLFKLPVLSIKWVEDAWEAAKEDQFFDVKSSETINKYRLLIFKGCVITISGFTSDERSNIGRLIELHGGVFSGEMSKNTCTHLITSSNSGSKFRKAVEWGTIYIVDEKWLRKSVETKYRLPEKNFKRIDQNTTKNVQLLISDTNHNTSDVQENKLLPSTNKPLLDEQNNTTQNSNIVVDHVDSMDIDNVNIEKNSEKKAPSIFDLMEKSTKKNSNENNTGLIEIKRQSSITNDKKFNNIKKSNDSGGIFKLSGNDINMSERDRNVMAWVEKCQDQANNEKRFISLRSRSSSILLGRMVSNIHQELLSSSNPIRANELKKEILEVLDKYELMLFEEEKSKLVPN